MCPLKLIIVIGYDLWNMSSISGGFHCNIVSYS